MDTFETRNLGEKKMNKLSILLVILLALSSCSALSLAAQTKIVNVGIYGSTSDVKDMTSYIKSKWAGQVQVSVLSDADLGAFEKMQFIVATGSGLSALGSSNLRYIMNLVKQKGIVLYALDADSLAPKRTVTLTRDDFTFDTETGITTSKQISQEVQRAQNPYVIYVDAVDQNHVRRTQVFEGANHEDYVSKVKQSLATALDLKIKTVQANAGVASAGFYGDWSIKWSQEYTGLIRGVNVYDTNWYTRFEIYYLPHPDDLGYEYYWIDPYMQHHVATTDYQASYGSWVGPWVNPRQYWVDMNAHNQRLYLYGPSGTQHSGSISYNLGLDFNSGGVGVSAGVTYTYDITDVTVADDVNQAGNKAHWIETLTDPDYTWYPFSLGQPCQVGHTSFPTHPSIIARTPTGQGLTVNQMKTHIDFYKDTDFNCPFPYLVLYWTRWHWNADCEWDNVEVNDPPPSTPSTPSGPSSGYRYTPYTYSTVSTDIWADPIYYGFDWGDGTQTTTGTYASGVTASASHSWNSLGSYNVKAQAFDASSGVSSGWSSPKTVAIIDRAPNTPSTPSGPGSGYKGISYTYSSVTSDGDGDNVCYQFDWGDGQTTTTQWYTSGTTGYASHSWSSIEVFNIIVRAEDSNGAWSGWSSPKAVSIGNLITLTINIPQAPATGHDTDGSPREPVSVYVDGVKYQIFSNVPATVQLNSAVSHTLQADRSFMKEEWKPGYYYIYTFMQWSDGVTSNPRSFTASGDTAISVFYLRSKYAIL